MIFSELYGAYYCAVAGILAEAIAGDLNEARMREIARKNAFAESAMAIVPAWRKSKLFFTADDYTVSHSYSDGDPYEDPAYIQNFRAILAAVKDGAVLEIEMQDRAGTLRRQRLLPRRLEYSRKDDKFRLYSAGSRSGRTINVARIRSCRRLDGIEIKKLRETLQTSRFLTLELTDQRNALERVMLHFSHFEKTAVKLDEEH